MFRLACGWAAPDVLAARSIVTLTAAHVERASKGLTEHYHALDRPESATERRSVMIVAL
jgi:hypothetical protein